MKEKEGDGDGGVGGKGAAASQAARQACCQAPAKCLADLLLLCANEATCFQLISFSTSLKHLPPSFATPPASVDVGRAQQKPEHGNQFALFALQRAEHDDFASHRVDFLLLCGLSGAAYTLCIGIIWYYKARFVLYVLVDKSSLHKLIDLSYLNFT